MPVAIKPSLATRIRAYAEANPGADEQAIARHFGTLTSRVRNALAHPGTRRIKSVAR